MPRVKKGPLGGSVPMLRIHRGSRTIHKPMLPFIGDNIGQQNTSYNSENMEAYSLPAEQPAEDADEQSFSYRRARCEESKQWNSLRDGLLGASYDQLCPAATACIFCMCSLENCAVMRCAECGPLYVTCVKCATDDHTFRPLHCMELWKGGLFQEYKVMSSTVFKRANHECATSMPRKITVVTESGNVCDILCEMCDCEPHAVTLRRFGLWPASPVEPRCAYSVGFLQWLKALQLAAHVSVHSFIEAVRVKNGQSVKLGSWMYRSLVGECFAEFRNHSFTHESGIEIHPILAGHDAICPACPSTLEDEHPLVMCLDGNFGLVRKRSSGESFEQPKHGTRIFIADDDVAAYVDNYGDTGKADDMECSNFRTAAFTASQMKKLDVTGVFGCVCKHEIPWRLMNLRHGERFAYAVLMIEKLFSTYAGALKSKFVMYDVACLLERHLKKIGKLELLQHFHLAVPSFHSYGHEAACQVSYNPRRFIGLGKVDGECVERLWSYLRKFNSISKEMTAAHRIDLLTDACLYYTMRKKELLAATLVRRLNASKNEVVTCTEELGRLQSETNVKFTDSDLDYWTTAEQKSVTALKEKRKIERHTRPWEEMYVADLVQLDALRWQKVTCTDNQRMDVEADYVRLVEKIESTEHQRKVQSRWCSTGAEFKRYWQAVQHRRHLEQLTKARELARERQFLLEVKRRHAVGQKLALRISKQIDRCSLRLRKIVKLYNSSDCSGTHVTETDAFNPLSPIYAVFDTESMDEAFAVPYSIRSRAIELKLRRNRACEEETHTRSEMCHTYKYFSDLHSILSEAVDMDTVNCKTLTAGERSFLLRKLALVERLCNQLHGFFKMYVDIKAINTYFMVDHTVDWVSVVCEDAATLDIDEDDAVSIDEASDDEDC